MTHNRITGTAAVSVALVLTAVTACGDSSGPTGSVPASFDAAAIRAGLDGLESTLQSPGWSSFAGLAESFRSPDCGAAAAGASRIRVIPECAVGRTLIYDGDAYVVDPDRENAPENGLRFVLYEIDPATSEPLPSDEIGHADLRDVGAEIPEGFELAVEVEASGTIAEYTASFEEAHLQGSDADGAPFLFSHDGVHLEGHLTNGVDESRFHLITGTSNGIEITVIDLFIVRPDLRIEGITGLDESSGELDVDYSVVAGRDGVRLTGTVDDQGLAGTFRLNGDALATVTGIDPVVIEPASGVSLTEPQRTALAGVVALMELIHELTHTLARPLELNESPTGIPVNHNRPGRARPDTPPETAVSPYRQAFFRRTARR